MRSRISACASTQSVSDPENWAIKYRWELSAQPGWDAAYAAAIENNLPDPGSRSDVITDGMILSAVQVLITEHGTSV
jgi:hypothetical protein